MKNLIDLTPDQVKSFEKIMEIHNKINNISNNDELQKILYKSRVLHGYILNENKNENKNEMTHKDYYNISIYDSLNDLIKNTIGQIEMKLQNSNNNNDNTNNNSDIPVVTDIENNNITSDNDTNTNTNINNIISKNKINKWFVLFHTPNCGHCVRFMPTWNKFEKKMNGSNINIVKINIQNEKYNNIVKKYQKYIEGYPTVLYIDKKIIKEYNGERTVESLVKFINNI
jgi:thiol-disulfide isomerase/thioredoxin